MDLHSSLGMLFVEQKHSGAIAGKPHERPEATRQALCHLLEKRRIESNVLSAAIVADPNVVNFLKDRYSSENGNANIHNDSINNESAHVAKSHYQFSSSRNISDKHLINASKDIEGQQDNSDIIHTGTMFSWFNQAINNNSDETQLAKRGDVTVLKCSTDNGIGSQPDLFSKRNNQGDTIIRGFCENEINERKKSDHNDELKKSWYELLTHANIRQCIENEIFNTTEVELLKISLRDYIGVSQLSNELRGDGGNIQILNDQTVVFLNRSSSLLIDKHCINVIADCLNSNDHLSDHIISRQSSLQTSRDHYSNYSLPKQSLIYDDQEQHLESIQTCQSNKRTTSRVDTDLSEK
ncbi:hypothetical protein GJ496_001079 [Pomphorhynchus laevis]|nr:hypothetical protein GJ496_001079 [Pomphorhynchus laevis]